MSRFFPTESECGHHTIFAGIPIRTYAGEQVQVALVDLPAGSVVEWHSHVNEQLGVITKGRVVFSIGDEERTLGPGEFYFIPSHVRHRVVTLEEPAQAVDIFHPIRAEYA
jgi:quercetin dioxygenase-like cupin family protein